jgi:hypothetical protein
MLSASEAAEFLDSVLLHKVKRVFIPVAFLSKYATTLHTSPIFVTPVSLFNSPTFFHRLILLWCLCRFSSHSLHDSVWISKEPSVSKIRMSAHDQVSLLHRDLSQNLSDTGDPISRYATGGISFELIGASKLPHATKFAFEETEIESRSSFHNM